MKEPVRIIGSYLSPYVRKVLVFLELKGITYQIDPIVPFFGDDRFSELSPIRRIPVLIDDRVTVADSSVICQYLEERYPQPHLYPADIVERARARWLEEFADTRMGEVFIWRLFNQMAIGPAVWGEKTDASIVEKTRSEDIPQGLDYLETQAPAHGYFFGTLSIADIAVAALLRNAALARFRIDAARWPRIAAQAELTLGLDAFVRLGVFEDRLMRTPPSQHRTVLAEMGAPLTADTCGIRTPRRGMMKI